VPQPYGIGLLFLLKKAYKHDRIRIRYMKIISFDRINFNTVRYVDGIIFYDKILCACIMIVKLTKTVFMELTRFSRSYE